MQGDGVWSRQVKGGCRRLSPRVRWSHPNCEKANTEVNGHVENSQSMSPGGQAEDIKVKEGQSSVEVGVWIQESFPSINTHTHVRCREKRGPWSCIKYPQDGLPSLC